MSSEDGPKTHEGSDIAPGDRVGWNWGSGHAEGIVAEMATERLTKEIKGKSITRVGTDDNPAFYVEREEKGKHPVVKKASELHKSEADEPPVSSGEHVETERQKHKNDY